MGRIGKSFYFSEAILMPQTKRASLEPAKGSNLASELVCIAANYM